MKTKNYTSSAYKALYPSSPEDHHEKSTIKINEDTPSKLSDKPDNKFHYTICTQLSQTHGTTVETLSQQLCFQNS